jgi:predicted alpha/beta-fold hydrolase
MPIIPSKYRPPLYLRNAHLQTIYPSLFRKVKGVTYERERIHTPDGDFLDLDWSRIGNERLGIIFHGLEGSSESGYARGMAKALNERGWDAMALNFRSCSGEPNLQPRFYHSGETSDPAFVIEYILANYGYKQLAVIGYSLGGNVLLKYLGEKGNDVPKEVKNAVAVSVPCELHTSCDVLSNGFNRLYTRHFLKMLMEKAYAKAHLFSPEQLSLKPQTFPDFDGMFTGPLHGFDGAMDYYLKSSSKPFIPAIQRPVLILNAQDDPFLSEGCFPIAETEKHKDVYLEMPAKGGHVGFMGKNGEYWAEKRVMGFLEEVGGV